MLDIATVNVNGIRAAQRHGLDAWLAQRHPDIVLLQEVRANDEIVEALLPGWTVAHQACEIKGRAGVAVATRLPFDAVRIGLLDLEEPVDTGRWVEVDITTPDGTALTVVSVYIHSGTFGTPKMEQKYAHLDRVTARLRELAATAQAGGRQAIIGGDINIAHREIDIKNWKGNLKTAGFLPEERAYLDLWFGEIGLIDIGRRFFGEVAGPYTWWSARGKAFDNDAGWRIDYQIATPGIAERVADVYVDRAASYEERFSDHAPLIVNYDA